MRTLFRFLSIIFLLCCFSLSAKATHLSGAELSYRCVGSNKYIFTVNLFCDCQTYAGLLFPFWSIHLTDTCGDDFDVDIFEQDAMIKEISQLCPADIPLSQCKNTGNPYTGMVVVPYISDTVTLPNLCLYNISYVNFDRNTTVNVPKSAGTTIALTGILNTNINACNNSPTFNTPYPIPYVCSGQAIHYTFGVEEQDGDSLNFALVSGKSFDTTNLVYGVGYSGTSPMPGITINQFTGQLSVTPSTTQGNYIVVVEISEYDRTTGLLKGTIMRDFEFVVKACTNTIPDGGQITNLTGNATYAGPFTLNLCEGDSFRFDAVFTDADAIDSLSLISNIQSVLPDATVSIASGVGNSLIATISWTAPIGSSLENNSFSITVLDNACPVPGFQTFGYNILLKGGTNAGADIIICGSDSAHLSASGGNILVWKTISGDMSAVLSCDTCPNPSVKPSVTTTFEVTSNLSASCKNKDTVTVVVVNNPIIVSAGNDTNVCKGSSITLNAAGGGGGSIYTWLPATGLSNPTIRNPIASPTVNTTYSVTVNTGTCGTGTDSIKIIVNNSPVLTTAQTNVSCNGGTNGTASVTATGGTGTYTYSWNTTPVKTTSSITDVAAGTYTISVTDKASCTKTNSVTIAEPAPLSLTVTSTDANCNNIYGNAAAALTGGTNPYTYLWNTTPVQTTSSASGLTAGTYSVAVTDANGCDASSSTNNVIISSVQFAAASFVPSPVEGDTPLDVVFTNTSTGAISYQWNFGDGTTSTSPAPTNTYTQPGTYQVSLIATSSTGCTDTMVYDFIKVNNLSSLWVPNVFTPNADKTNDVFKLTIKNIVSINVIIYNRWGNKIYEWTDLAGNWDGHISSGEKASDGVYFYVINAIGTDDVSYEKKGTVTLLR
ncbi:MAG: gliding motility-associated C-terminal domain-containing protein [Bacteroidetes bacterium]|nr:gliding motility-associated C-terminal domain-containing protein [Bacteroidota bacterium]